MTSDAILLTGVTGFLGTELLAQLLETEDRQVLALVRGADDAEAQARVTAVLRSLGGDPERWAGRVTAVRGDLTEPGLGLGDAWEAVAERTGEIVHGAASVSFGLSLEASRAINRGGTERVLQLAQECAHRGGLRRLTYISTAYVAGCRRGTAREGDLDGRHGFRNPYEQSKMEAESLVRRFAHRLPVTVVRPSIVVGHRATGWTSSFNVVYVPLRAFAAGGIPLLPARRRAPVDVVPVDYVAGATLALARHPDTEGGTYHLASGTHASTVGELIDLASARFGRPAPRTVRPAAYRSIVRPVLERRGGDALRRALGGSSVFEPYFDVRVRFDDARARALLDPLGLRPTPVGTYFDRLMDFAEATRWGRRPVGRGEAGSLAVEPSAAVPPRAPATMPAAA